MSSKSCLIEIVKAFSIHATHYLIKKKDNYTKTKFILFHLSYGMVIIVIQMDLLRNARISCNLLNNKFFLIYCRTMQQHSACNVEG